MNHTTPANPGETRLTLTRMRPAHLDAVLAIERQVYPRPWSTSLFQAELAQWADRGYWVVLVDGEVGGYGGVMMSGDDGHVTNVAVDPARQGDGLGTRLVLVLVEDAIERGARSLTLEVRQSNGRAQALYRRFAFGPVGFRKDYYADNHEDAIIMWAHDVGLPDYRERLTAIAAGLVPPHVVAEPKPWNVAVPA